MSYLVDASLLNLDDPCSGCGAAEHQACEPWCGLTNYDSDDHLYQEMRCEAYAR